MIHHPNDIFFRTNIFFWMAVVIMVRDYAPYAEQRTKFNERIVGKQTAVHVAHVFLSLVRSLSFRHETKERNEQGLHKHS